MYLPEVAVKIIEAGKVSKNLVTRVCNAGAVDGRFASAVNGGP